MASLTFLWRGGGGTGEMLNAKKLRKSLDVPERKNGSFLNLAVKQQKLDTIRFLTGNDSRLIIKDRKGKPVHMVEVNKSGQLGRTALLEACTWGNEEAVRMILGYKQGWELPFDNAAGIGLEEVNMVLADRDKRTPLIVAVENQHAEVVKLLTSNAARQHHPNVAMSLRCTSKDDASKFVDAVDHKGMAALHYVCNLEFENVEILTYLLKAQADVAVATPSGKSPLHLATQKKLIQVTLCTVRRTFLPFSR